MKKNSKKSDSVQAFARANIVELMHEYKKLMRRGYKPNAITAYDKLIEMCGGLTTDTAGIALGIANLIIVDAALQYITELEAQISNLKIHQGCIARYVGNAEEDESDELYMNQLVFVESVSSGSGALSILMAPTYGSAWHDVSAFKYVRQATESEIAYFDSSTQLGGTDPKDPDAKEDFKHHKYMESKIGQDLRDELKERKAKKAKKKSMK